MVSIRNVGGVPCSCPVRLPVADAGVLVLLRVPKLEHWVRGHVMAGR